MHYHVGYVPTDQVCLPARSFEDPLGLRKMAQLAKDVARGLEYLHSLGILHLDVKPANVLLEWRIDGSEQRDAPRAVLVDLGIAKTMEAGKAYAVVEDCWYSLHPPHHLNNEASKLGGHQCGEDSTKFSDPPDHQGPSFETPDTMML